MIGSGSHADASGASSSDARRGASVVKQEVVWPDRQCGRGQSEDQRRRARYNLQARRRASGRHSSMVEQLICNQQVGGSSPFAGFLAQA